MSSGGVLGDGENCFLGEIGACGERVQKDEHCVSSAFEPKTKK